MSAEATAPPLGGDANDSVAVDQICFRYSALDPLGARVGFHVFADDDVQAVRVLEQMGLTDVSVWPRRESPFARFRRRKVSRTDLGTFSLQLAQRTKANQPMRHAIAEMARVSTHPVLRQALYEVRDALAIEAEKVSDAFGRRPDVFPASFRKILEVGRKEGDPTEMLTKYGNTQLRTADNISKIVSALIYPSVILSLAGIIVLIMMWYVMPQMEEIYRGLLESTHAQLPLPTRILIGFSRNIVSVYGVVVMGALGLLGWRGYQWGKTEAGGQFLQEKLLRAPGIGPVLRTFNAAYTVHLMAILSKFMTSTELLGEIAEASVNVVYEHTMRSVQEAIVTKRLKLQAAFPGYGWLFGDDFLAALATAEDTGDLGKLHDHAELLDQETERAITRFSKLIEPATIVLAGTVIALVVISLYLPLFTLVGHLANPGK